MPNIEFSKKDLKQALRGVIVSPHQEKIVDVIVNICSHTDKLEVLSLALMGVKQEFPFKVFDEVWIKWEALPSWRMDKSKMRQENLLFKDQVKCIIVNNNQVFHKNFDVKFTCIEKTSPVKKDETYNVDGKYISIDYDYINLIE